MDFRYPCGVHDASDEHATTAPEGAEPREQGGSAAPGLEGTIVADRYRIERLLGEGGMGAVYRAEHTLMHKFYALKLLHAEMTSNPEVVARFEREAVAAGHIAHPNVAAATDFGRLDDGSFYLVLEYVEGRSLRVALAADGAFPAERCMRVARQIASALGAAHGLGIVHRDLKPDNVMLVERDDDPDFVKVLDFGIAKVTIGDLKDQPALTRVGAVFGTPDYMSPEQALGQNVDHRSDLYALGILMYEMLRGTPPFEAESLSIVLAQQITSPPPPLPDWVPPALSSLIMQLLAKEASDRPQTAGDVVKAIEALEGTTPVGSGRVTFVSVSEPNEPPSGYVPTALALPVTIKTVESVPRPPLPSGAGQVAGQTLASVARQTFHSMEKLAPALNRPVSVGSATFPTWLPLAAVGGLFAALMLVIGLTVIIVRSTREKAPMPTAMSGVVPKPALTVSPAAAKTANVTPSDVERVESIAIYKRKIDDWLVLSRGYCAMGRYRDCALSYRSVLQLERSKGRDPQVLADLRRAAQEPDAYSLVVNLAEGRKGLGETGLELLWDIWNDLHAKGDRDYADSALQKLVILSRRASSPLRAAIELQSTTKCEKLASIVARAAKSADARSLPRLRAIEKKTACDSTDPEVCLPCLRGSDDLAKAIKRAETRPAPRMDNGYR